MPPEVPTVERILRRFASRQHGCVTRAQLLGAAVSEAEIKQRLSNGALIPLHRGVYRVGHTAPSTEAVYMGAVLVCGAGAALCGRAAGYMWRLLKGPAPPPAVLCLIDVRRPGLKTRRTNRLHPGEVAKLRGIPITTVPRTLVDLASDLSFDDLALACHNAGAVHRTTPHRVDAVLRRRPNSPGAGNLRRILHGDARVALSELEREFLRLLDVDDLPLPVTNRKIGSHRVDCRWPAHKLTVELDSYRFHSSRHAWEADRRREREAYARGDQFRRYTWGDVFEDPGPMLRELRALLS